MTAKYWERDREAWLLRKKGLSYKDIATRMHVGKQRVHQLVQRYERERWHYLNTKLAIFLGIKAYEASQLQDFFNNCDLWKES